jgi:hypothetical protein
MARAGFVQADIAQQNIVALIKRQNANAIYIPQWDFEGSIKLTLGKVCCGCEYKRYTKGLTSVSDRAIGLFMRMILMVVVFFGLGVVVMKIWGFKRDGGILVLTTRKRDLYE